MRVMLYSAGARSDRSQLCIRSEQSPRQADCVPITRAKCYAVTVIGGLPYRKFLRRTSYSIGNFLQAYMMSEIPALWPTVLPSMHKTFF